jgi:uncharacterized membrane protein
MYIWPANYRGLEYRLMWSTFQNCDTEQNVSHITTLIKINSNTIRCRRGRDRMLVGFKTTYAISASFWCPVLVFIVLFIYHLPLDCVTSVCISHKSTIRLLAMCAHAATFTVVLQLYLFSVFPLLFIATWIATSWDDGIMHKSTKSWWRPHNFSIDDFNGFYFDWLMWSTFQNCETKQNVSHITTLIKINIIILRVITPPENSVYITVLSFWCPVLVFIVLFIYHLPLDCVTSVCISHKNSIRRKATLFKVFWSRKIKYSFG